MKKKSDWSYKLTGADIFAVIAFAIFAIAIRFIIPSPYTTYAIIFASVALGAFLSRNMNRK